MVIEQVPVELINPAAYNPRKSLTPGDAQYDALAGSIREFGFVEPLVWNRRTGNLVGGHQRLKVLLALGLTSVDCSVVDLPPDREKLLNLALNKVQGGWDFSALAALLEEVMAQGIDLALTGFGIEEAERLLEAHKQEQGALAAEAEHSKKVKEYQCPSCGHEWSV